MESVRALVKNNLGQPRLSGKQVRWARALYIHMSRVERLALAWLLIAVLISGIWSVGAYIDRHTHVIPRDGGIYREAAVGQPRYLNPILAGAHELDGDISRLVYSSLFTLDSRLQLQKDLAAEYELSADQLTYTIHLRTDAQWHDGEAVTADDVVFTIRSIQTPEYGSPLATAFQGVTVEKVDDHTVTFHLKQPYAPFLTSLTVGITPQHVWENIAPKNATLAEQMLKPVGSGPYKFLEIKTRRKTGDITEFRLTRNPSYYGTHQHLDEIVFMFFANHEEAIQAFIAGNVDGVGFLPLQLLDEVKDRSSVALQRLRLPQYFGLFFNQEKNKLLADANIRNALGAALDRQAIVDEALRGEGEPLHLPIPPGLFSYATSLALPTVNLDTAKQNLEEAGWRDVDGDGVREKDNERLRFTIATTDWPEYVHTAEIVQKQWQAIGVETQITHFGAGSIQQTVIRPRDYEILLFGEILSADPDPYPFWHSTQTKSPGLNFSLFQNSEVDKLLEDARKTLDLNARREQYEAFQGKILELKPALILYRPYYLFATKEKVRGITSDHAAGTSDRFNNISEWHVRTKRVWGTE